MILYHTSDREIRHPDIHYGRKNADFGWGFYLTPDRDFTYRWARENAVVNEYELDDAGLDVHRFTRDVDWFQYIFDNRRVKDGLTADVVVGPIANDTIFDTLGIISSGFFRPEDALRLLLIGPEYTQVAIKTEKAASQLRWVRSERIEQMDGGALKAERDAYQEKFATELEAILNPPSESELYKELGALTRDKDRWEESVPYLSSLLAHESTKIKAKSLWLLGEIGLAYPTSVQGEIPAIASFCDSPAPLLRERAVNALGRIGRGDFRLVEPYWEGLFRFASDEDAGVRLSFVWASENIATNTPDIYEGHMPTFARLLHDENDKVRMEAPEIFRVLGKRRPEFVLPYLEQLQRLSETDDNRVVRIHCLGAIRATQSK